MDHENKIASSGSRAVLLIHGGAGAINKTKLTAQRERVCRAKLEQALLAGHKVIAGSGSSLDAVIAAVKVLEDAPIFNAGKGSCLTRNGKIEMDAAIMEGSKLDAGAVAGITCVKNPVTAARAVLDHCPHHVLLVGSGADSFARKIAPVAGLKIVEPEYFRTKHAEENLERFLQMERMLRKKGKRPSGLTTGSSQADELAALEDLDLENFPGVKIPDVDPLGKKYGTVGAVALDRAGNLAAATSTGGTVGKDPGRVGDSPIIGAGTFADNDSCAVSATGTGEHFIRNVVGHEVSALIKYKELSLQEAVKQVIFEKLARTGGDGGLIAINREGEYAMFYNTLGMYRGVLFDDGRVETAIF